jgi:hypothetical protein
VIRGAAAIGSHIVDPLVGAGRKVIVVLVNLVRGFESPSARHALPAWCRSSSATSVIALEATGSWAGLSGLHHAAIWIMQRVVRIVPAHEPRLAMPSAEARRQSVRDMGRTSV